MKLLFPGILFLCLGLLWAGCERAPAAAAGEVAAAAEEAVAAEVRVVETARWNENFSESVRAARRDGRQILLNFTGSDWSPPCSHWREQILDTAEFAEYAAANLVLIEVDYPKHKVQPPDVVQQNQVLQAIFEVEHFPTLILLRPDGEEVERISGVLPARARDFVEWLAAGG